MTHRNATARNFILTLNPAALEFEADILDYLRSLNGLTYLLVTEHIGNVDTKHHHVYVQYENSKKLSIRKLRGAHVERCFGSAQANIRYCKAQDEKHQQEGVSAILILEEGRPNLKGQSLSVGDVIDLEDEEMTTLPAITYNVASKIRKDFKVTKAKDFRKEVKVYWIQGPTGKGKTNKAIDLATELEEAWDCGTDFIKFTGDFYLGTTKMAKIAIYDDFRDSHMKPAEFINLIDYNKHWMNVKGDQKLNEYNCVILTSVQKLDKIYRNVPDEPRKQWERRITVIDMYPPEPVSIGGYHVGYRTDFNQLEEYEVTDDWDDTTVVIDH